jgi:hypothetical protein
MLLKNDEDSDRSCENNETLEQLSVHECTPGDMEGVREAPNPVTAVSHFNRYFFPDVEPGLFTDLKSDPLGVMGLEFPNELPLDPRPGVPILLQSLCAAGVSPPLTRGLLGNFGTGVLSTLPVSPFLEDSFFD